MSKPNGIKTDSMSNDLRKSTIVLVLELAIMAIILGVFITGVIDLASGHDEYMRMYYNRMIPDSVLTYEKGMWSLCFSMLGLMAFMWVHESIENKHLKKQLESEE